VPPLSTKDPSVPADPKKPKNSTSDYRPYILEVREVMGERGIQHTLAPRKPIPRLRLIEATANMIFIFSNIKPEDVVVLFVSQSHG
jgi:hypothetical protein